MMVCYLLCSCFGCVVFPGLRIGLAGDLGSFSLDLLAYWLDWFVGAMPTFCV